MPNNAEKSEKHDYCLCKKRHASVSEDTSCSQYLNKKQKIEKQQHSFEDIKPKKKKIFDTEQAVSPKKQKRKECALENGDFNEIKNEVQSPKKEVEETCYTSTPKKKKKKKKHPTSDNEPEESVSESRDLIITKASKTGERHPFFGVPINSFDENGDGDVSESIDSVVNVKDKKHKKRKKNKTLENSFNFSDLSDGSTSSKVAKQKKKSKIHDSFTVEVYDSESVLLDPSFTKKNLKKHKKRDLSNETDYSIINQSCNVIGDQVQNDHVHSKQKKNEQFEENGSSGDYVKMESSDIRSDQHVTPRKKKKKKMKDGPPSEENGLSKVVNESVDFQSDEHFTQKKKKKKKVEGEQLSEENHSSRDCSNGIENLDTVDENLKVKKKKHKRKQEQNKENEDGEMKKETYDDQINGFHKSENMKQYERSEATSSFEEQSGSKEINHEKRKKSKSSDCLLTDIPENQNEPAKDEISKNNEENVSNLISSINQSFANIKKTKKKRKIKKESIIKSLLSNYEYKREEKDASTRRKHSILLDGAGELNEKIIEEKPRPFETADLSLIEVLEDVKNQSRLNDEEFEKLKNLNVIIPWPVPPFHLIETRVAGCPTESNRKSIEALGVKIKTGKFSKAEDEQIKGNWKYFYQIHDLSEDPTPFLNFATPDRKVVIPTEARINFVRFLAHGLEDRLLCSVYQRFRRLFLQKKLNFGRFTPKEDEAIINFLNDSSSNTPYSDLAKILNRNKYAVEKRCEKLAEKVRGYGEPLKWDRDLVEEFMKHLVDVTKVKVVEELKDRKISLEEWKEMSNRLDISVGKLQHAWNYTLYSRVFVKERLFTREIKKKLINRLIESKESDWRAVNWNKLAEEFEGFTGKKLNRMMKDIVSYHVPLHLQDDLEASLKFLCGTVMKLNRMKGYKIRRLKIVDRRPPPE